MSELRTLNSSWPFFTSSPRRASISTMRPVASEGTGTCSDTSGFTSQLRSVPGRHRTQRPSPVQIAPDGPP